MKLAASRRILQSVKREEAVLEDRLASYRRIVHRGERPGFNPFNPPPFRVVQDRPHTANFRPSAFVRRENFRRGVELWYSHGANSSGTSTTAPNLLAT